MNRRRFLKLAGLSTLVPLAGGLPLGGCARRRDANVVCVLVDQLRKDSFDRWCLETGKLAARGVAFENMRSVAPWTYPSVISLMSGLFPQQHGADGYATKNLLTRFSPKVPLLQRLLKGVGYRTAAFTANPFLREWNSFHAGFDSFHGDFVNHTGTRRPGYRHFAIPERMFSPTVNRELKMHFKASGTDAPEFTYIHYIDVHGPWRGAPFSPNYEAAVRFIDGQILELYDFFMERYDGDVYFFVTSDHGRYLNDDLEVGYGKGWRINKQSMHDFNLRIPFVLLPSRRVAAARSVAVRCSNIDFTPTLVDLLGVPPALAYPAESLAGFIRGEEPAEEGRRSPIYAQNWAFGSASDCLVADDRKYMRFFSVVTGKLLQRRIFDLASDPRETRSLGSEFGPAEAVIARAAGTHGHRYPAADAEVPPDIKKQLEALGYLDG
jgi:arylsulfatase A-like enzyme